MKYKFPLKKIMQRRLDFQYMQISSDLMRIIEVNLQSLELLCLALKMTISFSPIVVKLPNPLRSKVLIN